jgi:lipoprotein-releasing system permease protein
MFAIAVSACAMIILLSVFNGFEGLVSDLYKAFYPDIKITSQQGKFFSLTPDVIKQIQGVKGVDIISKVLEDNVLLTSNDEQRPATVKGIDDKYLAVNNVQAYLIDGDHKITVAPNITALVGLQVYNEMGLDITNVFSGLTLYYPNASAENVGLNPESAFQSIRVAPQGVFQIQDEFDSKYILAPISAVQQLMQANGKYTSIEIKLGPKANADRVKKALYQILGEKFLIQKRFEQNRTLYMIMRTEKWAIFAILCLVMLIASFNMIGALSLLVLEKQKDMAILLAMGATKRTITSIFVAEGILWSLVGGMTGLFIGTAICLGQKYFEWIKLGESFIINAYPVELQMTDFLLITCTIITVGLIASWYPGRRAVSGDIPSLKSN